MTILTFDNHDNAFDFPIFSARSALPNHSEPFRHAGRARNDPCNPFLHLRMDILQAWHPFPHPRMDVLQARRPFLHHGILPTVPCVGCHDREFQHLVTSVEISLSRLSNVKIVIFPKQHSIEEHQFVGIKRKMLTNNLRIKNNDVYLQT